MKIEQRILSLRKNENDEYHKPQIGVYHASSIFDIYKGYVKPEKFFNKQIIDDQTLFTFEIGKMYHNHIQALYPETQREIPIRIERGLFRVIGRVDLVLGIDGIPCELKTCTTLPNVIYPSHECQTQMYLEGLNKDEMFLTYIEKNPKVFITKNFKIKRDKELFEKYMKVLGEFHQKLLKVVNKK